MTPWVSMYRFSELVFPDSGLATIRRLMGCSPWMYGLSMAHSIILSSRAVLTNVFKLWLLGGE